MMLQSTATLATAPVRRMMRRRHSILVAGSVVLFHAALLLLLITSNKSSIERPIESHAIAVQLLNSAPSPLPVVQSTMQAATPFKQHVKLAALKRPMLKPIPTALFESLVPPSTPMPASPAPAAPAAPAATILATAMHPAPVRPTLAMDTPKEVSHLDCSIARPDYPNLSKRRNENGTVIVKFVVDLMGHIEHIQLQKSSGYLRLDEAALDAMHASTCQPYKENGETIRVSYSQPFVFGLTD